ncbi:vomeronasal type-2 receptor 26-like [Aquarana catesbeiana]|uniref:vomeronasal type-2 receptor 26-like n=1 Tax=Aquarana catesbeiana TaxID=8400 RepID=UPI003CC97D1C
MSKTHRCASATRSRSPRDQDTQISRQIPEIFRTRPQGAAMASQTSSHEVRSSSRDTLRDQSRSSPSPELNPTSALSLADLCLVATDIKNTLSAAISDLHSDIQDIVLRVEEVEETQARHDTSLCHVQQVTESHAIHLRNINRHMEDLDNRGRCRNLMPPNHNNHTANLRVPEDLEHFCTILNIPLIDLPDWYSDFSLPPLRRATSMDGITEAGNKHFCIRRHRTHPLLSPPKAPGIPVSRCSGPCLPGTRKKFGSSIHKCCYECISCPEGEISNISDSENCMKCPDDEWPNEKKDGCIPRVVEFLSYTDDPIVAIFSAVSILCCLLTGLILGIFIHYQDTPIVKANNRDLSYLLLVSIMLSFLCVFLFLGHPVDVTCMLRVTSFGVIFSVAVSSLLAKSIMVCIAFKATKPGSPWRKWMGAKLPNFIICVFSLVQVIICVTWLSISPPFHDQDTHSYQGKIIIQCNEGSVIGFYSVLGYMGLLAAVSFIIAFLARTLPDSFNEAKYITFSMLVFCSVWIALIPAYLSTRGKYMVAVEVFAIMASSSGLLGCIFFPKCYIILFRSDLNIKSAIH